jgi:large subunit ribosomal protein L10
MSKYVKNLITDEIKKRLTGVNDALVVSIAGLDTAKTYQLRKTLRSQNVQIMMIKNSLARRAVEGTPLVAAFEQAEGSLALMWGSTDIVSLAKIAIKLAEDKNMTLFVPKGGAMDGTHLTADQVKDVSKWPSREEVLAKIVGQILGPGSQLLAAIKGPGGALASQVKEKGKEPEGAEAAPAAT